MATFASLLHRLNTNPSSTSKLTPSNVCAYCTSGKLGVLSFSQIMLHLDKDPNNISASDLYRVPFLPKARKREQQQESQCPPTIVNKVDRISVGRAYQIVLGLCSRPNVFHSQRASFRCRLVKQVRPLCHPKHKKEYRFCELIMGHTPQYRPTTDFIAVM